MKQWKAQAYLVLLFDVNVLIAAHRPDHPHHRPATALLEQALATPAPNVAVLDAVWVGLIRICTNRRAFKEPSSLEELQAFISAVRQASGYFHLVPSPAAIDRLLGLCERTQCRGDLVTDAYIAAIALDTAATVVTFDRDFRRFDGLKILDPSIAA